MAGNPDDTVLDTPKVHLVHMLVFTLAVAIVAAVLAPQIKNAFMANVMLNSVIIAVLLLGILYCYRMVWRLWPEVNWVNGFRDSEPPLEVSRPPVLLAPMATLLGDRQGRTVLSPMSMRTPCVWPQKVSRMRRISDMRRRMARPSSLGGSTSNFPLIA